MAQDLLEAPRITSATPGNGQVTLAWTIRDTQYQAWQYQYWRTDSPLASRWRWASAGPWERSATVKGLTNGAPYRFRLRGITVTTHPFSSGFTELRFKDAGPGSPAVRATPN